jgi:secretory carrier-associated membrane protein
MAEDDPFNPFANQADMEATDAFFEEPGDSPFVPEPAPKREKPRKGRAKAKRPSRYDDDVEEDPRATHQPLMGGTAGDPMAGYGASAGAVMASASTSAESEVESKRRMLDEKERELREKEQYLKDHEAHLTRRPNWPKCCPVTYHNIPMDISDETLRKFLRTGYIMWLTLAGLFMFNFICVCIYWGVGGPDGFKSVALALGYLLVGIPLSFYLWYRFLYNACRKERKRFFDIFHILFLLQQLFNFFVVVGVSGTGTAYVTTTTGPLVHLHHNCSLLGGGMGCMLSFEAL